ncbi:hypothetical protein B0H17DRAFT_1216744 [Mycena rosella]|uniref:Uncharacterized protein n=1 Tax=Mycena rosella TaxID=1033263 RepID=A0AAD7C6B3_MYCRO|nr:hypothetical protein B0H17DRAFT_1216744 [Mycena rosella]
MATEFGPLASYHLRQQQLNVPLKLDWHVQKTHTLPAFGPPEASRIVLIIREHEEEEDQDEDDKDSDDSMALDPPAYTPVPRVAPMAPAAPAVPVIPAIPPPGLIGPVLPVAPAIPAAQAGQFTAAINLETVLWLGRMYSDFPVVAEIRTTAPRASQTIPKLLEWCQQVHNIKHAHPRVPDNAVGAGIAVGHQITLTNLGVLFLHSPVWIKDATTHPGPHSPCTFPPPGLLFVSTYAHRVCSPSQIEVPARLYAYTKRAPNAPQTRLKLASNSLQSFPCVQRIKHTRRHFLTIATHSLLHTPLLLSLRASTPRHSQSRIVRRREALAFSDRQEGCPCTPPLPSTAAPLECEATPSPARKANEDDCSLHERKRVRPPSSFVSLFLTYEADSMSAEAPHDSKPDHSSFAPEDSLSVPAASTNTNTNWRCGRRRQRIVAAPAVLVIVYHHRTGAETGQAYNLSQYAFHGAQDVMRGLARSLNLANYPAAIFIADLSLPFQRVAHASTRRSRRPCHLFPPIRLRPWPPAPTMRPNGPRSSTSQGAPAAYPTLACSGPAPTHVCLRDDALVAPPAYRELFYLQILHFCALKAHDAPPHNPLTTTSERAAHLVPTSPRRGGAPGRRSSGDLRLSLTSCRLRTPRMYRRHLSSRLAGLGTRPGEEGQRGEVESPGDGRGKRRDGKDFHFGGGTRPTNKAPRVRALPARARRRRPLLAPPHIILSPLRPRRPPPTQQRPAPCARLADIGDAGKRSSQIVYTSGFVNRLVTPALADPRAWKAFKMEVHGTKLVLHKPPGTAPRRARADGEVLLAVCPAGDSTTSSRPSSAFPPNLPAPSSTAWNRLERYGPHQRAFAWPHLPTHLGRSLGVFVATSAYPRLRDDPASASLCVPTRIA